MNQRLAIANCKLGIANCEVRRPLFACSALSCLVLLLAALPAWCQTPLRWQLEPGQALTVRIDQETATKVAFSGKSAETKIELGLVLRWTVDSAAGGQLKIKQTVERITFSLQPQAGPAVKFDSQDKARPSGQARQVADAVKPLLGAEVLITMNGRGQILETAPGNAAAEKLFAASGEAEHGAFSPQAVGTLLRQPLAIMPEKPVSQGEKWSDEPREIASQAGKFLQTMEYALAGQVEDDGQKVEKIGVAGTLKPAAERAAKASKLTLKSHEQSGTIWFSTEQGRLVRAEQSQKLATERPYRETTISVDLDSKQTTIIAPAGE